VRDRYPDRGTIPSGRGVGGIMPLNNAAERALRGIAVGRRNWTFAGSDRGGERAAAIYTLIETAKLNGVDPQAWLADVLGRLADHPAKRITDLLPWNWDAATRRRQAALGGITAEDQRS
jgi:transposase